MVRTRATGTPERSAVRSLSPTAMNCLPRLARMSRTAPAPTARKTTTDQGSCSSPGTSSMPPRPSVRNPSVRLPFGAPSVHEKTAPSRMSSIPSVVMNDGTRRRVVISPLATPTAAPIARTRRMTSRVLSGWSARTWAATTTVTVTSDPTDRSYSPLTITKYCPAARTASGAARLRKARKPAGSVKFGFSMAIQTRSTASTPKIGALRATDRHSRSATEGRGGAAATSSATGPEGLTVVSVIRPPSRSPPAGARGGAGRTPPPRR